MRFRIGLLLAACLLAACPDSFADDEVKGDLKKLQGEWKCVSAKRGGEDSKELNRVTLKIEGPKFILLIGGGREEATAVRLDGGKKPKQIDFVGKDGKAQSHGIYKLDGKQVTFCFVRVNQERPTKFESAGGTRTFLIVFERKKKE